LSNELMSCFLCGIGNTAMLEFTETKTRAEQLLMVPLLLGLWHDNMLVKQNEISMRPFSTVPNPQVF
jgi:hypothetical protein